MVSGLKNKWNDNPQTNNKQLLIISQPVINRHYASLLKPAIKISDVKRLFKTAEPPSLKQMCVDAIDGVWVRWIKGVLIKVSRETGYQIMATGVVWEIISDYKRRNRRSPERGQRIVTETRWYPRHPDTPHCAYRKVLTAICRSQTKRVIDGITGIYPEEPEFWCVADTAKSSSEWQKIIFPWRPQHESPENTTFQ